MNTGLKGKVAIVGGSSKGLGRGCAIQLAKEGAHVVICARGEGALRKTAAFIKGFSKSRVLAVLADLSKTAGVREVVRQTIKTFGRVDIIVVNSGGPRPGSFFDLSEQDWKEAFDSVLNYAVEFYRLAIPYMKKQKWGRIINITSLVVKEPSENLILSNVFRSGVTSLAKTVSRDLIKHNITVNTVCPGAFKTDRAIALLDERSKKTGMSVKEIERDIVAALPLGRYQTPEEIGDLVVFLASDRAKGITGTTIQIDGGMVRGLF